MRIETPIIYQNTGNRLKVNKVKEQTKENGINKKPKEFEDTEQSKIDIRI